MIDDILAKFDGAFAINTIRAYRSDFIQYETWCSHNNIDSLPATDEAMAQYDDYLASIRKVQHPQKNKQPGHDTKTLQES